MRSLKVRSFGTCEAGDVTAVTITDGAKMKAEVITLGASLRRLIVPDRDGNPVDVVLGYPTVEGYTNGCYFGATVGRYGNRIADSELPLGGKSYPLVPNEGPKQLHGGPDGFSRRNWSMIQDEKKVTFRLASPDLDQGFPGNLDVQVVYSLEIPGELHIIYDAVCDKDTVVNMTNHSYFNLSGQDSGAIDDELISVAADAYTPVDEALIPTGEIAPVEGTDFDLRPLTPLGEVYKRPALAATCGFDHYLVLNGSPVAAVLKSPRTGIVMETVTDQPGIQVYMAGGLGAVAGKDGVTYGQHHAVCLETQHFPDSVHHDNFPSVVLKAGEQYHTETVYRFRTE